MRMSDVYNLMYDMQVVLLMLMHANNKHGLVKKLSQCGIGSNITQKHYQIHIQSLRKVNTYYRQSP